ncbi:LPS export ABC transporter periplasmic protein LptC [sulfur-oxidizing endosymbiont of Gigantopelta aegis]|uniref:LPS export ABC transporter periplasmic protein LptC n=1 Tax=sulfur-oxidizing endosymbiont of Gigantopelta aegis TaxID=2794934 RepID=UPI0018DC215D|nr:LPS export ABC transporter periplasmic protein LptC [sulfur-oxidizing endosymbiont of Gigantopelta aegis]
MDKKLFTLLLSIPAASIAITWFVYNNATIDQSQIIFPQQNIQKKVADTFFNGAEILNFSVTGIPKSKIIGEQIFHYPDEEDSEIVQPRITLFRTQGLPVKIQADHGWINKDGTRVFLKGHTVIRREKSLSNQFSQLESPELTIWPNKDYAETDKAVKITTDSTIATGVGMKAYMDKERYYLLNNVKGRHIPAKAPTE